jgi:hypothetical protein
VSLEFIAACYCRHIYLRARLGARYSANASTAAFYQALGRPTIFTALIGLIFSLVIAFSK